MTALFNNVYQRFKASTLEISGFSTAAVVAPLTLQDVLNTIITTVIVALLSGSVGALAAHFMKKIISKFKW